MLELTPSTVLLLTVAALITAYHSRRPAPNAPPTYGPRFLPSFVGGILAVVRLGKDEDGFLLSLKEYGPCVYIPWPMQQYFVTDGEAIRTAYAAPTSVLSFYPIRREMQGSVFGAPYWKNERLMNGEIFPVHGKGMNKLRLTAPLQRFIAFVRTELDQLAVKIDSSPAAETTLNLGDWIAKVFFEASLTGMFGSNVLDAQGTPMEEFYQAFLDFDAAFPIEASGMVPPALLPFIPDVKKGRKAREVISSTFTAWISGGFEGLEEGVIRDMANIALENDLGVEEAGKLIVADFWALQANAPYIATQLLNYVLQAPSSLRSALQAEADASLNIAADSSEAEPLTFPHLATTLPLLGSCISETMRLGTSTFSIRDVEQPFVLPGKADKGKDAGDLVIPAKTRLLCITRVDHLDDDRYDGNAAEWDGRRFMDREGEEVGGNGEDEWRSKRAREVYGFGGGISRCEGQHFATAEMKAFASLLLSRFDVEIVSRLADPDFDDKYDRIKLTGVPAGGFMPKRIENRIGMGAFQLRRTSPVEVRLRRRKQ